MEGLHLSQTSERVEYDDAGVKGGTVYTGVGST